MLKLKSGWHALEQAGLQSRISNPFFQVQHLECKNQMWAPFCKSISKETERGQRVLRDGQEPESYSIPEAEGMKFVQCREVVILIMNFRSWNQHFLRTATEYTFCCTLRLEAKLCFDMPIRKVQLLNRDAKYSFGIMVSQLTKIKLPLNSQRC